jgi:hypothetical protein
VGAADGAPVGAEVGCAVGLPVGASDGASVGALVGTLVGAALSSWSSRSRSGTKKRWLRAASRIGRTDSEQPSHGQSGSEPPLSSPATPRANLLLRSRSEHLCLFFRFRLRSTMRS